MEIVERGASGPESRTMVPAAANVDQLRTAMRAAQVARVLAESNRHFAEVTERRARQITINSAMHRRAARRLRIQAGAQEIEARRQESAAAWIRNTMRQAG